MKTLRVWIWLLFLPSVALGGDALPLEELYGAMDRSTLEAEVSRSTSPESPADEPLRLKRLGIAWHNLAALKVSGASRKAVGVLEQAAAASPEDVEVLAYLGSARTQAARDSWNVITKVSEVNKGAALLDKAVRTSPDNPAVRMVRANNSLALPAFFGRRAKAIEDFDYLHRQGQTLKLRAETRAEVCFHLGQLLAEDGHATRARALFEEARALAPGSMWAQRAAQRL